MKKISFILFLLFSFRAFAQATPIFEYEIWMQAETSLDPGPIEVKGNILNTGLAILDLSPRWAALGGLPSNLNETTSGLEYVNQQLQGATLTLGENFPFFWLIGTQEQNLTSYSGSLLSGSLGLIPLGSDWHWTQGGFIPELLVHSEWVNGPADSTLPFNKVVINLNTAGQYIVTPSSPPYIIPEPSSLILLGFGLLGAGLFKRKDGRL